MTQKRLGALSICLGYLLTKVSDWLQCEALHVTLLTDGKMKKTFVCLLSGVLLSVAVSRGHSVWP